MNIWAGITNRTTTEPVLFCQNLRSDGYEIILENHLRPFIDANSPSIEFDRLSSIEFGSSSVR